MKLIIESLVNGWTVRTDDGENLSYPLGFTYDDTYGEKEDEIKVFAQVLREVNDQIGPSSTRYDKARIYVNIEPGDKHEDTAN